MGKGFNTTRHLPPSARCLVPIGCSLPHTGLSAGAAGLKQDACQALLLWSTSSGPGLAPKTTHPLAGRLPHQRSAETTCDTKSAGDKSTPSVFHLSHPSPFLPSLSLLSPEEVLGEHLTLA